jgi:hypothetical protein
MRKLLAAVLVIIIAVSNVYSAGLLAAKGSYRSRLAQFSLLRTIFYLHDDGDARADYLGDRYQQILLEINAMDGGEIRNEAISDLAGRMTAVTGKQVAIYYSTPIPRQETLTSADITRLEREYRRAIVPVGSAYVHVLVLPQKTDESEVLGMTVREDGLVLFADTVERFAADSPATVPAYEASTLLHEFGHQIGLDHNDEPDCLMNARAEQGGQPRYAAQDVVTDFCPFEKQQITRLRQGL